MNGTARSRARRLLAALGKGAALLLVFVVTLVVAAIVHVDTPRGRRLVAGGVTAALDGQFRGRFVLDRVGRIGLDGVSGIDARLVSDTGDVLVSAQGLAARADVLTLARRAVGFVAGTQPTLVVALDEVSADHLAVDVGRDSSSVPKLLRALESPKPPVPSSSPGPELRLGHVRVHHAWIFGSPRDGVAVDVEVAPLDGRLELSGGALAVDVDELSAEARGAIPGQRATLRATGRVLSGGARPIPDARVVLGLTVSDTSLFADAVMLDGKARVRARLPDTTCAVLGALVPAFRPRGNVAAALEAEGDASHVRTHVVLDVDHATLTATARATPREPHEVALGASLRGAELATFSPSAPDSRLGADLTAKLRFPAAGATTGEARLELVDAPHIGGITLPKTTLDATLDATGDARAELAAADDGIALSAHARLPRALTDGTKGRLSLDVKGNVDLARASRLGKPGRGTLGLDARGSLDLGTLTVDAAVDATVARLAWNATRARTAHLSAHVEGSARAPRIAAALHASDLDAGPAHIHALDATTMATTDGGLTLDNTHVRVAANGTELHASAPTITLGTHISAPRITITGLGAPIEASLSRDHGVVRVAARTDGVELGNLASLLHVQGLSGRLVLSADATISSADAEGVVHARLAGGALPGIARADVLLDAGIVNHVATAKLDATLGDTLTAKAEVTQVRLAGPALLAASWASATGFGSLDARADLDGLTRLLAPTGLPMAPVAGRAHLRGSFSGDAASRAPSLSVAIDTAGLELLVARPGGDPLRVAGIDGEATLKIDGATGFAAAFARAYDRRGELVAVDTKGTVPLDALLARDFASARAAFFTTPLAARVTANERELASWPRELVPIPRGTTGSASAVLVLEGTPSSPRLTVDVVGKRIGLAGARASNDLAARATYDGATARASATLGGSNRGRAEAELDAHVPVAPLLSGQPFERIPWSAGGRLTFESFALEALPPVGDDRVRGSVDGSVTLSKLNDDAALDLDLRLTDAGLADARAPKAAVRVHSKGGRVEGALRVEQSDGHLEGNLVLGVDWGARLVPLLDTRRSLDARLVAKSFRLLPLRPFVASALADLDGRLDADARVVADPTGTDVRMFGGAELRDVGFVATALGQELRDVGAKVTFLPGGVVEVTGITASDGAGRIDGAARARFDGLDLSGANARFEIAKARPFDVMLGGQTLGNVYGRADVTVRRSAQATRVSVELPSLHVRLSDLAGKAVQELPQRADIKVGVLKGGVLVDARPPRARRGADDERRGGGATLDVAVKLGSDVDVRRGAMVTVQLTGEPRVHVEEGTTAIAGSVQLVSGSLDLQGKKFAIERGTVTFDPQDPANPTVLATASWTAKDRTRVIADFVGPVKTGKVTLRSEPARPQSELLQLIVFGAADGFNAAPSVGQKPGATTRAAAAFGGNALAQGLDSALDGLTGLTTQTRIDTTSANNPRPELEVQVARDIWLKFAYVLGTPPIHEPDKSLGSVVVRFAPNWTLSTTVGDRGKATMDTVWQYRY
jgi:translocation and assembly module TamB